ncbi:DUF1549 domain-containing protein [Rhodopirellula bahusiensis]|uniref:DUF1549 domain-containing protein n=1 Tax=Rhodopirellula bahusiensis TaxID=2014065 RepID=UPI003264C65C
MSDLKTTRIFKLKSFVCIVFSVLSIIQAICFADEARSQSPSPEQIAKRIDHRLLISKDDTPLRFADDATLLRRVSLDLSGRIPTISEVRNFLHDSSQTKYGQVVDRLMNSGVHVQNEATLWRRTWIPQADTREYAEVADDFEMWVVKKLQQGIRYDQLVREVITWKDETASNEIDPSGFYVANESKPENLAASATRAFLGINLDCAQCHDHPFSRWTREQFWQTAAFFAEPKEQSDGSTMLVKVKVPDSKLEFAPKLLKETKMEWPEHTDSVALKSILADWILTEDQNYLARNAINRMWSHYFGTGLVEPMDDLSSDASQSGPRAELLNELARIFVGSGYDTQLITSAIVLSDAYRLSSEQEGATDEPTGSNDLMMHAARVRGLSADQLYNSLLTSAGRTSTRSGARGDRRSEPRQTILLAFHVGRVGEAERSISQALTLMNGSFTNALATKANNPMLASVLASPFMNFNDQIDTIFVATLGRHAGEEERNAVHRYAESQGNDDRERSLGDLYWAIINSPEFNTNH